MPFLTRTNQMSASAVIAKYALKRVFGLVARAYLARPFTHRNCRRVCIYYAPNRISFSQVYPFIYYEREIARRYHVEIRYIPVNTLLKGRHQNCPRADIILLQTWFTVDTDLLSKVLSILSETNPNAEISFLDSFAHSDIRLSRILNSSIRFYIKKSLFLDYREYLRAYHGDTNLTEYYGGLFGIDYELIDWKTPESVLNKLRIGPNFFTAPHFIWDFAHGELPSLTSRKIDIHARIAASGTDWYKAMRTASLQRISSLPNLKILSGTGVNWKQYMAEMQNSKLCFSPFGYGELCWRDVEAFATGAVLIKPDMSHLKTLPNLYVANETYIPTKWDFSDLHDVVHKVLSDDNLRKHVATEAYTRVSNYVRTSKFVDDMSFLFDENSHSDSAQAIVPTIKSRSIGKTDEL